MRRQANRSQSAHRMALLRLVAALAVMLLAVLPHATLAASSLHISSLSAPKTGMTHGLDAARGQTKPCHEQTDDSTGSSRSMPSCCILGCGLLGEAPRLDGEARIARWEVLSSRPLLPTAAAAPEPAERPPRHPPTESNL